MEQHVLKKSEQLLGNTSLAYQRKVAKESESRLPPTLVEVLRIFNGLLWLKPPQGDLAEAIRQRYSKELESLLTIQYKV
jgi:hypothetical protein